MESFMRFDVCLFGVLVVVAGCATVAPDTDLVTLSGKVTDRHEVSAARRYVANEDATRAVIGAVGLVIAQLGGTPRHYVYTVESTNGTEYSVPVRPDVTVGDCLTFSVPRAKADRLSWQLDDVRIEANAKCIAVQDSGYDATLDRQLDANGNNALHRAIWDAQTKRALRIIEKKSVDLNSVNRFGATALHLAVTREDAKIARALIDAGASPDIRDNDGATPVMDAKMKGNREILELFKMAGAN